MLYCFLMDLPRENHDDSPINYDAGFATSCAAGRSDLPSAEPKALQHLSDNRVRQQIMQESQMQFSGRCVCWYQTKDSKKRSCKGSHEVIKTQPAPICYPSQVTSNMMSEWRQHHP
jgi:hypothetical protein